MTIRHLRIFLAVCENDNNLTRAAEKLFMAQPAVSLAISELEEYYGARLFDRLSRRLYLTEAGKRMLEYASHICALFDELERGLRGWDESGVLRVGASITIGSQFMPSYVGAYCALFPHMDVRVSIGPSDQLEESLLYNRLDFALTEGTVHTPGLVSEEYMEDSLAVICSGQGASAGLTELSPEEFSRQRFLLREPGSGTRELFDSVMEAHGFRVQPVWEAMSTNALVNAAIRGLGVAVVPRRMVAGPLERGLVRSIRVLDLEFCRSFRIVRHRDKFLSFAAKSFIDLCKNYEMDYPLPKYCGLT